MKSFYIFALFLILSSCSGPLVYKNADFAALKPSIIYVGVFQDLSLPGSGASILRNHLITALRAYTSYKIIDVELLDSLQYVPGSALLNGTIAEYRYKRGINESPVIGLHLTLTDPLSSLNLLEISAYKHSSPWILSETSLTGLAIDLSKKIAKKIQ
jgi:hypothetical protein